MQEEFYFVPKSGKIIYVFCNYRNREIFTKLQSLQYYFIYNRYDTLPYILLK